MQIFNSLYVMDLLEVSLDSKRFELIYKIGKQICSSLTPQLITELHEQQKLLQLEMDKIKRTVADIMSGSGRSKCRKVVYGR